MRNICYSQGTEGVDPEKDMVIQMAQRLYDHFSSMWLNYDQWVKCLNGFLADSEMGNVNVEDKISSILSNDKHLPLDQLSEEAKKAVYREVAEWLVAEKICERMVNYEHSIQEGLETGKYRKFQDIEEVNVLWNDGEAFGSAEDHKSMADFLRENYVVDMEGPIVGAGTRVVVRELKPVNFPLPYPEKDELLDGLMIKTPNKYLVVRLIKDSYKHVLGKEVASKERAAIQAFLLASESLFFTSPADNPECVSKIVEAKANCVLDDNDGREVCNDKKQSFIPPLMIIKAKIEGFDEPEYITVQKKIIAKGSVRHGNAPMYEDMLKIPGLRQKIGQFVEACKNFYASTGLLPDMVGDGNVLYTKRGNVYLVDINNITSKPDYKLIGLIGLANRLLFEIGQENESKDRKSYLESEYTKVSEEISAETDGKDQYQKAEIDYMIKNLYTGQIPRIRAFLKAANMVDDLYWPIFMYNLKNLMGLEQMVLKSAFESGEITEDEYALMKEKIQEDPLYLPLCFSSGAWKNKKCYSLNDMIDNKQQGNGNWIAYYANRIYSNIESENSGVS